MVLRVKFIPLYDLISITKSATNLHHPHHVALTTLKNRIHKWLITVHRHLRLYPRWAQDLRVLAEGNNRHTDTNDWGRTTIVILTHHHPLQQDRITCQMLHVHRHLRQNDHILIRYPLHLPHHLSRFRFSMFYFFFFQENELGLKICSLFERNCTAILIV